MSTCVEQLFHPCLRLRVGQLAMMLSAKSRAVVCCRVGENGSNGLKWKDASEEGSRMDKSGAGEMKICSTPCLSEGTA